LVVSINTIAGKDNIEPNRFAEMDFSSAYNDGFYNASNHPNYNAFGLNKSWYNHYQRVMYRQNLGHPTPQLTHRL
jgi:hypothetical protein